MAATLSALFGYDLEFALKEGFMDLSPMKVFNHIASRSLIIKTVILT
jgi:hypothetical protein